MSKTALNILTLLIVACVTVAPASAVVTAGADFNGNVSFDTDADNRFEDTTGISGFEFLNDTAPAAETVSRVAAGGATAGITHAYDFPGGFTGQGVAGGQLVTAGTTTTRSFQNATGDWTNEDVSIEIWFKPDNLTPTPTNGQILFEDGGGTGLGLFVDNNELRLRKAPGGGNVTFNISGISGDFIQAVATYDVSAGAMELFVNGTSVGTATPGGGDWSGGDAFGLGTRGGANTGGIGGGQSGTESFDGQIGIFRLYRNQILTDDDVFRNLDAVTNPAEILWDDSATDNTPPITQGDGNGDQNWTTNSNWRFSNGVDLRNDVAPGIVDRANIAYDSGILGGVAGSATPNAGVGGAALIKAGDNIQVSSMRIGANPGLGYGGHGRLDMTGGSLIINDIGQGRHMILGAGGNRTGTFVMSGGVVNFEGVGGRRLIVGNGDGQGFLELSGGTIHADRGGFAVAEGGNATHGTARISGGTLNVAGGNLETAAQGTGHFIFTGGVVNVNSNNFITGQGGDSEAFVTIGGGGTQALLDIQNDWNTNNGDGDVDIFNNGLVELGRTLNLGNNGGQGGLVLNINGGTLEVGVNGAGDINYRNGGPRDQINLQAGTLDLTGGNINLENQGATTAQFAFTGGTLIDVNQFNGTLTQDGGTLEPGGSIDVMNIGNNGDYDMNAGTLLIEYADGSVSDLLHVLNGDAFLDGTIKFAPDMDAASVDPLFAKQTFDILTANSITFGNNFAFDFSMVEFDRPLTIQSAIVDGPGNQVTLRLTVFVPEPATATLALLGIAGLAVRRRRRVA